MGSSGHEEQRQLPVAGGRSTTDVVGEHRIQLRVDDEEWSRAQQAAQRSGLTSVSKLCELLLNREYERLGIAGERERPSAGNDPEAEHRIQIRVKETHWGMAQELAGEGGFASVSDFCRHLLEEAFRGQQARVGKKRSAKKSRGK